MQKQLEFSPSCLQVITALIRNCSINSLVLAGNPLFLHKPEGLAFFRAIKESRDIEHLDLANCDLGPDTFPNIFKAVACHPRIQRLDVSCSLFSSPNRLGTPGLAAFISFLENACQLTHLSIRQLYINLNDWHSVLLALNSNRTINYLNISENFFTDDLVQKLCSFIF